MNKSMKPAVATAQRPLTEEEKKIKVMQYFQQKREQFAINILCNLCQSCGVNFHFEMETNPDLHTKMVNTSVEMADALIEKLYPMPEEETETEEAE